MSGTQVSAWQTPNELLTSMETPALVQRNQLMNQEAQQTISSNEMEQASRAANWIISQDPENKDPAKQAQSYTAALRLLRANNYALKSPDQYPGFEAMQYLARAGTPSKDLYQQTQDSAWANANRSTDTIPTAPGATAPGGGTGATIATPGTIEPEAVSRANAVRDGLMKRGLDYDTATAFAANALHESSANPNTGAGDAGASHGLFQWRGDRYDRYVAKYGHSPDNAPLDEQLDYVLDELNGPESLAKGRIAQAQGPEGKAGEVSQAFLRPKDVTAEMAQRSATAKQLAALGPAPATPGMTDQQWLQNQGRQYPSLASAGAGTPGQAPAAPGAAPTPAPYQVATAGATVPGPPTAPQNQVMPGQPNGPPAAAAPAATPPVATAPPPPAISLPPIPPPPTVLTSGPSAGLTPAQAKTMDELLPRAARGGAPAQQAWVAEKERLIAHNEDLQRQYAVDVAARQDKVQAQQERAVADARAAATQQREEAAAAALAEQRRIENKRQQEAADRDAQRLAQGSTQADKDTYTLTHNDPSTPEYAEAWTRKKWSQSPNGNVIENDVSEYRAPTRSIQRPSFLPAPTPQGLDEVRKADTDAKVITSAIDHYVDVFAATGGKNWGAYFDNPQSPESQQLIGAYNRMKTVLRSPQYYNTGVLQPAEIKLLSSDLLDPGTLRGLFATPQALATRLGEIKLAVLTRQDAELRSIGKNGVIVRDKADFAQVPDGGRYYDEEGHLHVKPGGK